MEDEKVQIKEKERQGRKKEGRREKLKFGVQFDEIETSVICGLGTGMDSSRPSS